MWSVISDVKDLGSGLGGRILGFVFRKWRPLILSPANEKANSLDERGESPV